MIFRTEFRGSSKVMSMKLQTLRHDFETTQIKNNESVQNFIINVVGVINQMEIFGEPITNQVVVAKVLQSLISLFDYIVVTIEESKDLSKLTVEELSGSLQAHEAYLNRSSEEMEEKALHVKSEGASTREFDK